LMKFYLSLAIFFCKITNTRPSYLLHPLDLIGGDKITALAFFPGMNIDTSKKVEVFKYALKKIKSNYQVQPMLEFANYSKAKIQQRKSNFK
jgi:peptidoglycan-N-acetylglucosamine deacetylase